LNRQDLPALTFPDFHTTKKNLYFYPVMNFKKTIPLRVVIHPRDVENITGKKGRTARNMLQLIRKKYGKQKQQFITVDEFCRFTGLEQDAVRRFMVA
jgi:predicted RNA-binding protein YlqC (UPF0109 family)